MIHSFLKESVNRLCQDMCKPLHVSLSPAYITGTSLCLSLYLHFIFCFLSFAALLPPFYDHSYCELNTKSNSLHVKTYLSVFLLTSWIIWKHV